MGLGGGGDWIIRLAEYGPIDLVAAHVWWPQEEYARRGLPMPGADVTYESLAGILQMETEAALCGLPANVKHRIHLDLGLDHIGEQLLTMAERDQVDVVVLGTHPHRGPLVKGSVSHEVLSFAPMSVACVPGSLLIQGLSTEAPERIAPTDQAQFASPH